MALTDIAGVAVKRLIGRLCRRAVAWLLVLVFGLAALYQATVAVTAALEMQLGVVYAHLVIAGIYAAIAGAVLVFLWTTLRLPAGRKHKRPPASPDPEHELQMATIVEAMLLGYSLSRRK
jgi:hypothetical protein